MTRRTVLVLILNAGLLSSLFVAAQRAKVESRNKAVELVVDYNDVAAIVAATDESAADILRSLKNCGVTSLAVTEWTVRDMIDAEALNLPRPGRDLLFLADDLKKIRETARHLNLPPQHLARLPVGFPPHAIEAAKAAELEVVGRLVNYPGAKPHAIKERLTNLNRSGIRKVIFEGDQVLGFRGAVKDTADAFRHEGLIFGRVEFAKQKGETELAERAPANVIPVHSITQAKMPTLSESAVIERFQKAVRERGVRICYVRMYATASDDLLRANCDYIRKIARAITDAGYTLKSSHPMEDVCAPLSARVLTGAAVGAGAALLLLALFDLSAAAGILWSAVMILACAGLAASGDAGRKVAALGAALVFPTLAALWAVRRAPEPPSPDRKREGARSLARAIGGLLGAVAITVVGGLLVVGLLSSRAFMLRIDQFMGIKVAHLLPILVLAGAFAGGIAWEPDTWQAQKRRLKESFARILESPVAMWQAIGLLAALILIGLMVARSGNDAGLEVSSVELKLRSILDRVLVVRPRTKEFLIGYPLLLLGLAFAMAGQRRWGAILVTFGSIGLISALNSFCHIHTPLAITALRTVNGLVIGTIIGLKPARLGYPEVEGVGVGSVADWAAVRHHKRARAGVSDLPPDFLGDPVSVAVHEQVRVEVAEYARVRPEGAADLGEIDLNSLYPLLRQHRVVAHPRDRVHERQYVAGVVHDRLQAHLVQLIRGHLVERGDVVAVGLRAHYVGAGPTVAHQPGVKTVGRKARALLGDNCHRPLHNVGAEFGVIVQQHQRGFESHRVGQSREDAMDASNQEPFGEPLPPFEVRLVLARRLE